MDRVIVGIDGSDGSVAALRFAVAEARQWDVPLVAVRGWEYAHLSSSGPAVPDPEELSKAIADQMVSKLEEVLGSETADTVEVIVVNDPPVRAILDEAGPNDLIVVGSRGMGGLRGMLLGSVSQQVAHYARCPVVIVHPPTPED